MGWLSKETKRFGWFRGPHGLYPRRGRQHRRIAEPPASSFRLVSPPPPTSPAVRFAPIAMVSPAAYSRARRLFSVFSSTTPRAQALKPAPEPALAPAPGQTAADGEVDAKPHAGRNRGKSIGKILRVISEERDPDKLVSQFITASTTSRNFRDNRRVYEVAVSRLASYGRRDAVAALLDSQKPFIEASGCN
jgi:hypothetical protein